MKKKQQRRATRARRKSWKLGEVRRDQGGPLLWDELELSPATASTQQAVRGHREPQCDNVETFRH